MVKTQVVKVQTSTVSSSHSTSSISSKTSSMSPSIIQSSLSTEQVEPASLPQTGKHPFEPFIPLGIMIAFLAILIGIKKFISKGKGRDD